MKTSDSIKNITTAMIQAQSKIEGMTPDAKNPFFKSNYITLDGILEYIRPILSENSIWIFQNASGDGEYVEVTTRLMHSSGEYIETDTLRMKPQKLDAQQMGSCITYAKRYQLASLLGISSEVDDDGNKATYGNKGYSKNGNSKLSEAQIKRLFAIGAKHGITTEQIKSGILRDYKKTKAEDLTKAEYDELVEKLERV